MVVGGTRSADEGEAARPIRVVAFDDRPVYAKGLHVALSEAGGHVQLVAVLTSVRTLGGTSGDVALVSPDLRDGTRLAANVEQLRRLGMEVLVYTDDCDVLVLTEALEAGACGVVCTYHPEEMLLDGIRSVHRGEIFVPDDVARMLAEGAAQRPRLSAREIEVLNLLYQGLITKQTARRLQVSESTVKEHLKRIRLKYTGLGRPVSTRVQLLQVAYRDGFITTDGPTREEARAEAGGTEPLSVAVPVSPPLFDRDRD